MSTPAAIPAVDRLRYSDTELPPYSYVPKHAPHPVSDPAGHWFGREEPITPPLDPQEPYRSKAYLYGIDLFNHGYYWEAHEAWESLWHAAGRTGVTADWLKALIKLAAALVKAREGNPRGVERHARRTLELLDIVTAQLPGTGGHYCGLSLARVEAIARGLVSEAATHYTEANPTLVLRGWLEIN
ncbi:DUF309 domain-containing protein [Adhaeretor mobilis]|uniref:DUF309 domain-containing protein n=1 Tax=Adhaeretor mobilis TaxID=1930276 RepID=A0A517MWX2_9BACT|nr:DUF309 domain-containing protein [Adhaeretor mobilis]QDS99376.1 hypothetical protein HG15A2_26990 [Adhaeretor mobilis]